MEFLDWREKIRVECPVNAAHVDTRGVHFPRVMPDADAFEQPAELAISDRFTFPSCGKMPWRHISRS